MTLDKIRVDSGFISSNCAESFSKTAKLVPGILRQLGNRRPSRPKLPGLGTLWPIAPFNKRLTLTDVSLVV
ncbi:hypothetical protein SAMN05428969_0116 [Devosia sp. YR412]|nr:hypothetical protein SAMN05428969_0116 [Devosia sp. YR412]